MDAWLNVLQKIAPQMQRSQFITWFKNTAILGCDHTTLIVGVPFAVVRDWHVEHGKHMTLKAVQDIDPSITHITYELDGGLNDHPERCLDLLKHFPEKKPRKLPNKPEVKVAEGVVSKMLNPKYTLENFVVGVNNRLAHAACQAVSTGPGGKYNPLFLYGGVGLGKTHLLQAVGNGVVRRNPQASICYITSEEFTNQVVQAIRTNKMEQVRKRYRQVDVLIVDDIQFFAGKDRTQEEFFHTFNALYEGSKQLVISADRSPEELYLEKRLISRFERGMVADVREPDYETRLAILAEKAKEYELIIDLEVLQFIAEHTTKNVRELEGILMQAVAQYDLEERTPTIGSIAEIMTKLNKDPHQNEEEHVGFEVAPKKKATLQDVMEAVSVYYSISIDEMTGLSRVQEILKPRQVAMYIAKHRLGVSFVKLGDVFGRDHTTVINAVNKIEMQAMGNAQLMREIHALETELNLR